MPSLHDAIEYLSRLPIGPIMAIIIAIAVMYLRGKTSPFYKYRYGATVLECEYKDTFCYTGKYWIDKGFHYGKAYAVIYVYRNDHCMLAAPSTPYASVYNPKYNNETMCDTVCVKARLRVVIFSATQYTEHLPVEVYEAPCLALEVDKHGNTDWMLALPGEGGRIDVYDDEHPDYGHTIGRMKYMMSMVELERIRKVCRAKASDSYCLPKPFDWFHI